MASHWQQVRALPFLGGAGLFLIALLAQQCVSASNAVADAHFGGVKPSLEGLEPLAQAQIEASRERIARWRTEPTTDGRLAREWRLLGKLYHAYGFIHAGISAYTQALTEEPAQSDVLYLRGLLLRQSGEVDRSLSDFQQALDLAPTSLPVQLALYRGAVGAESTMAQSLLPLMLQLHPREAAVLAAAGESKVAREEYEAGVEYLQAALELAPSASRLYALLALAYRGLGDKTASSLASEKAGAADVEVVDPWLSSVHELRSKERLLILKGEQALQTGDLEAAVEAFEGAVTQAPDSVRARVNLGISLSQLGDTDNAVKVIKQGLMLEPENTNAAYNLAMVLRKRGDLKQAGRYLELVVAQDGEDLDAIMSLADIYLSLSDYDRANYFYQSAVALRADYELAWMGGVKVGIAAGEYAHATRVAEAGLVANPGSGLLKETLIRLLSSAPDPSIRDGDKAWQLAADLQSDTMTIDTMEVVAMAAAESGQCELAVHWQDLAVQAAEQITLNDADRARLQRVLAYYSDGAAGEDPEACRPNL